MLRRLATIAIVVVVGGSSLFAADGKNGGIARQIAMGGSQAGSGLVLNPFIMDDPALMLLNPAYQAMYKDYAWMNVGGGTLAGLSSSDNGYGQQNVGIGFSVGREWSFGAILSYDPSAANLVSGLIGTPGFVQRTGGEQTIPPIANVWEVLAAFDMGTVDLGFAFTYGSSNRETKASTPAPSSVETEASASMLGFRLGANIDLGGGSSFDLSGAVRLDNATDNVTVSPTPGGPTDGEYSASGTEIQVQLRGRFKVSNRVNFVPYGLFATLSAEPKEDKVPTTLTANPGSLKASALAYAVGVGGEYRTPSFYLAGGLSFQSARLKTETSPGGGAPTQTDKTTYTALPVFNIGGEWWFTDWLAGRGGYTRALATLKEETENGGFVSGANGEEKTTIPHSFLFVGGINPGTHDGLVTLGLGFRFGGFALDATVSEEALRRGLGLIGASDNINTFGYITTSYNFE